MAVAFMAAADIMDFVLIFAVNKVFTNIGTKTRFNSHLLEQSAEISTIVFRLKLLADVTDQRRNNFRCIGSAHYHLLCR